MTLPSPSSTAPVPVREKAVPAIVEAHTDLLGWLWSKLSLGRLYRRLRGGKWELWFVDTPVGAKVWHRVGSWSVNEDTRPSPLCRGRPIAMEWNGQRLDPPTCAAKGCNRLCMIYMTEGRPVRTSKRRALYKQKVNGQYVYFRIPITGYSFHVACEHHTPGFS